MCLKGTVCTVVQVHECDSSVQTPQTYLADGGGRYSVSVVPKGVFWTCVSKAALIQIDTK